MSNKVKPWHSAHRQPKHIGKRPRHKHVMGYDRERDEDPLESIWQTLPPIKDVTDGESTSP